MVSKKKFPPPFRGVIVVDTGSLLCMSAELNSNFAYKDGAHEATRMADMLFYLARNGYHVIIPEMVAHECGGYMRNGFSTHYFDQDNELRGFNKLTAPVFERLQQLRSQNSSIPIWIQKTDSKDQSEDAQLINAIWHASKVKDPSIRKERIAEAHKLHPRTSQAGDRAARRLLSEMDDPHVPVFYLSEDYEAHEQAETIGTKFPVNHLTYSGMFHAFAQTDLLKEVGIKDNFVSAENPLPMAREIENILVEHGIQEKPGWRLIVDCDPKETENPFLNSLFKVKRSMDTASSQVLGADRPIPKITGIEVHKLPRGRLKNLEDPPNSDIAI